MQNIFLVSYKVKGIKTLEDMVSLSFYKKTITRPIDTQEYNIKGIYGMNGSGKSGIVNSVEILRNLLIYDDYLNNPMTQKTLEAMVNKKTKELYIGTEFLVEIEEGIFLCSYEITLKKNSTGKFNIDREMLSYRNAVSRKDIFNTVVEVVKGEIVEICEGEKSEKSDIFIRKTTNLLNNATISALFREKVLNSDANPEIYADNLFLWLFILLLFGVETYVYIDQSDNHVNYFLNSIRSDSSKTGNDDIYTNSLWELFLESAFRMGRHRLDLIHADTNFIRKDAYQDFVNSVRQLKDFIKIFKPDLTDIDIDKKEDEKFYICNLNMVYGTYSINTEFESTGIKKLIKLFAYLQKMTQGGIVFIDEFDSNLHDVYLCALLEYLMEHGKGQLCFTTHNLGPMDILKKHKKSIDFLSIDHKIYPWIKNGNYSPSKLYKSGMIEGSPFNVESIDFIGIFDLPEED